MKNDLDRELALSERSPEFIEGRSESKGFSPHITLARIGQWEWKRIEPEERPEINEDINFVFEVDSIEIMESELKRGGAIYSVFESYPLGK